MSIINIIDHSPEIKSIKQEAINRALEAIGIEAEKYAKLHLEDAPRRIDTGRLRNSVSHVVSGDSVYVGTNVEYAPYVEFGTVKMAPNHFLKNAASTHTERYKAIAEMCLKG
jgi:HK97 gp10 family phage protein